MEEVEDLLVLSGRGGGREEEEELRGGRGAGGRVLSVCRCCGWVPWTECEYDRGGVDDETG